MVIITEVTSIPTILHTEVVAMMFGCIDVAAWLIPTAVSVHSPRVPASIGSVEYWTPEIEEVATWIAGINAEVPISSMPVEWTIEI